MDVIVDTETTGLTRLSYANRLNYKEWPRMVQVAWALVHDGAITERHCLLIRPDNYSIPPSATQIHGICQEEAFENGCPITEVLSKLYEALFGFGFFGKHDAANDLIACFHVYKKLKNQGF